MTRVFRRGTQVIVRAEGSLSISEIIANRQASEVAAGHAQADRVQTGLDRTQTGQDRVQTGLDRVQTGLDRQASQEWAEGTEPGGAGTKSSREHAQDGAASAGQSEGFRNQAQIFRDDAEGFRDQSASSAAEANTSATQAELAALAAGAPIVTSLTAPVPANGTVELLKLDAGLQVHEVVTGDWVLRGWLVGPKFDTVQLLMDNTASTFGPDGTVVEYGPFRAEVDSTLDETQVPHAGGVKLRVLADKNGEVCPEQFGAPFSVWSEAFEGDDTKDAITFIEKMRDSFDHIRFNYMYSISRNFSPRSNTTITFGRGAGLFRLKNPDAVGGGVLNMIERDNVRLHGGILDSAKDAGGRDNPDREGPSSCVWMAGCENIDWTGAVKCRYSNSFTFNIRPNGNLTTSKRCKNIHIDTIVVQQEDVWGARTNDAVDIISVDGGSITKVVGIGDHSDDLVVFKSFPAGDCENFSVGQIIGNSTYGLLSFGGEVVRDIKNITIGSVIGNPRKYGIFCKQNDRTASFPSIPITEYGMIKNILVGQYIVRGEPRAVSMDEAFKCLLPLSGGLSHYVENFTIGQMVAKGVFWPDVMAIRAAKGVTIGRLDYDPEEKHPDEERTVNRHVLAYRNACEDITIGGGRWGPVSTGRYVDGDTGEHKNITIEKVKFLSATEKAVIRPRNTTGLLLSDLDLTALTPVDAPGGFVSTEGSTSANRASWRIRNCAPLSDTAFFVTNTANGFRRDYTDGTREVYFTRNVSLETTARQDFSVEASFGELDFAAWYVAMAVSSTSAATALSAVTFSATAGTVYIQLRGSTGTGTVPVRFYLKGRP